MVEDIEEIEKVKKKILPKYDNIFEISSEDFMKLVEYPFTLSEIQESFNLSDEEFKRFRKEKGIENTHLETAIRNIDSIIYRIDNDSRYISKNIRKRVISSLINVHSSVFPKHNFYLNELLKFDYSVNSVKERILNRKVDLNYRLRNLESILYNIDNMIDTWREKEKNIFINYNEKKLYNQLLKEKKSGTIFKREDLTEDILYELSIIETIPDSLVSDIFNIKKEQVRYLRKKFGMQNKFERKINDNPEALLYYLEKKGMKDPDVSNDEYQKILDNFINIRLNNREEVEEERKSLDLESFEDKIYEKTDISSIDKEDIPINIGGKSNLYHVFFSDEKYYIPKSERKRKNNGSKRNYNKENKIKIQNGKIGEQIVLKMEEKKLKNAGLSHLINDIKLVAQFDEEITYDGVGYDLLSYDEKGQRICIEVKTSIGNKDKPFFISKNELNTISSLKTEHNCKNSFIYYVLIHNNNDVEIKKIDFNDFSKYDLKPVLYKIDHT